MWRLTPERALSLGRATGFGIWLALVPAAAAQPGGDPVVSKVLKGWEDRHRRVKAIRYEIEGEWFVPKEALGRAAAEEGGPASTEPWTKPVRFVVILDLEHRRGRIEGRSWNIDSDRANKAPRAVPVADIGTWDGEEGRGMADRPPEDPTRGSARSPDMIITRDPRFKTINPALRPLFWGHGGVTTLHGSVKDPDLFVRYRADVFTAAGTVEFRGTRCTVLKSEPRPTTPPSYEELWVDMGDNAAVRKRTVAAGKQLTASEEAEYQLVAGTSLVKSWVRSTFRNGALVQEWRMRVVAVDPAYTPRAEDFRLEPKPGMYVERAEEIFHVDQTGRWVKVGNDPDMEQYYREHGRTGPPLDEETADRDATDRWWQSKLIWIAGAALAALAIVVVVVRRIKRSRTVG